VVINIWLIHDAMSEKHQIYGFIGEEPAKCCGNVKKFLVQIFY